MRRPGVQALQDRQEKRRRLAGARRRAADQVATGQDDRDGLGLDRRRAGVAHVPDGLGQGGDQVELVGMGWSQGLIVTRISARCSTPATETGSTLGSWSWPHPPLLRRRPLPRAPTASCSNTSKPGGGHRSRVVAGEDGSHAVLDESVPLRVRQDVEAIVADRRQHLVADPRGSRPCRSCSVNHSRKTSATGPVIVVWRGRAPEGRLRPASRMRVFTNPGHRTEMLGR